MSKKKQGTVRIIGGRWRGRKLPVPDLPGLRPSGDRGRETLFNWLAPYIHGARCADLFAGTGALGLEAASRGAASVILVEKAGPAARVLRQNLQTLESGEPRGEAQVVQGNALEWLETRDAGSLDLVFVDPPFGAGLEERTMELLAEGSALDHGGLVYLETARRSDFLPGPGWEVVRDKAAGDVQMRLLKKV